MHNSIVSYFLLFFFFISVACKPADKSSNDPPAFNSPAVTPPTAAPPHNVTSGLMTITTNTTLNADHRGQIKIDADNITLDCANYKVSFMFDNTIGCGLIGNLRCGIRVNNRSGFTIKNCEVSGAYDYGVWIAGSTAPSLVDNVTVRNSHIGFRVENSGQLTIRNSKAITCTGSGNEIRGSFHVTMVNVSALNNGDDGIDVNDASYVNIQKAEINGNKVNGVEFDGALHASVENSVIRKNGKHGISLDPSELAPLVESCSDFSVASNIIELNAKEGLRMQDCDNGNIRNNTSQNNGDCNADQIFGTGNTWTKNILQNWCGLVPQLH